MKRNYFYIAAIVLGIVLLIFFWKLFLIVGIIVLIGYLVWRGFKQDNKMKKRGW